MNAELACIGLGTWPLGGRAYGSVPSSIARAILQRAAEMRIPWLDTADIYGGGTVEGLIGEVFQGAGRPRIVTKFGYVAESSRDQCFAPETFRSRLEQSLGRLRRDHADVLLLHSPPPEVLSDNSVRVALTGLRREGLVSAIGVSLASVRHYALLSDWDDLDMVEVIYNLLDQRAAEFGLLDDARRRGRRVIARLPLSSGFLTTPGRRLRDFEGGDTRRRWPSTQLSAWDAAARRFTFLERNTRSMAQAAIAFCCASPGVSLVIPGAKTLAQLEENLASDVRPLSADEFRQARAVWSDISDVVPN
jgi:aryl-alcohol dehydrogenase-like predicted oxidoreductase